MKKRVQKPPLVEKTFRITLLPEYNMMTGKITNTERTIDIVGSTAEVLEIASGEEGDATVVLQILAVDGSRAYIVDFGYVKDCMDVAALANRSSPAILEPAKKTGIRSPEIYPLSSVKKED